jgi:hypothetical protein
VVLELGDRGGGNEGQGAERLGTRRPGGRRQGGRRQRLEPGRVGIGPAEEELVPAEASIALAAVGVEDPELGPAAGRPEPVPGDGHLGSLADDVPPEPDPGPPDELQPKPGRARHRRRQALGHPGRLEQDQGRPGSPAQRRQAPEPIGKLADSAAGARREVHDEEVDRSTGEQRAGDRQALLRVGRRGHDEPFQLDPAGDRLDRVEAPPEIEPGHDPAGRLGLRRHAQRERRPTARAVPPDGDAGGSREAARAEDRVELGEAGRDDPVARVRAGPAERGGGWARQARQRYRSGHRARREFGRGRKRRDRERTHDLAEPLRPPTGRLDVTRRPAGEPLPQRPWGGPSPAHPEGRQSRRHVRGERRHRTTKNRTNVRSEQGAVAECGPSREPARARLTSTCQPRTNPQGWLPKPSIQPSATLRC